MENGNVEDGHGDLTALCDNGFDGDTAAMAQALGRDKEQIADMLNDDAEIDEDLEMKIHGIAEERGISLRGD